MRRCFKNLFPKRTRNRSLHNFIATRFLLRAWWCLADKKDSDGVFGFNGEQKRSGFCHFPCTIGITEPPVQFNRYAVEMDAVEMRPSSRLLPAERYPRRTVGGCQLETRGKCPFDLILLRPIHCQRRDIKIFDTRRDITCRYLNRAPFIQTHLEAVLKNRENRLFRACSFL